MGVAEIKRFRKLIKLFTAFTLAAALVFIYSNHFLSVKNYTVKSPKLPNSFKGYKIALITDLHNASFGKDNNILIKKLEEAAPDLVLLGGDMVSTSDTDYSVFFSLAEKLAESYDTYFIVGNHEQALGEERTELFYQSVESLGVKTLNNKMVTLEKNGEKINLYGMWFNLRYYTDRSEDATHTEQNYYFGTDAMEEILGKPNNENFNLLLTHNPLYFETYAKWGADLTLSGHTHGGMIRIPFKGGVYSPEKTFFPEYDGGLFEKQNKTLIVSRGLGNGTEGFRLFNPPELVFVVLER